LHYAHFIPLAAENARNISIKLAQRMENVLTNQALNNLFLVAIAPRIEMSGTFFQIKTQSSHQINLLSGKLSETLDEIFDEKLYPKHEAYGVYSFRFLSFPATYTHKKNYLVAVATDDKGGFAYNCDYLSLSALNGMQKEFVETIAPLLGLSAVPPIIHGQRKQKSFNALATMVPSEKLLLVPVKHISLFVTRHLDGTQEESKTVVFSKQWLAASGDDLVPSHETISLDDEKTPSPLGEHFSIPLAWDTAEAHIQPTISSTT
jgi:hypothetical protein